MFTSSPIAGDLGGSRQGSPGRVGALRRVPEFSTVFVGGGPAGTGPLICALQMGQLEGLLNRRIAVLDASDGLVKGTLGKYIVNSDTPADVFLECLHGEAGERLSRARQSAEARTLYRYTGRNVPLPMVSQYLAVVGQALEQLIAAHPQSEVFTHTRVELVQMLPSGRFLIHAVDADGRGLRRKSILAHSVVLATGGRQCRSAALHTPITPDVCLGNGFAGKVLMTDELLSVGGGQRASRLFLAAGRTKVVIVGGSHGAFSSAWALLHKVPGVSFGRGDITVLYRRTPRLFFASAEAALEAGYREFGEEHICPRTHRVHRLGGLRFDGRQLLMRIWGLEAPREDRVRLLHLPAVETEVKWLLEDAAVILPAFGYRPAPPVIVDHRQRKIELLCERGGPLVNDRCQLLRADGSALPNVYGIGLASGFVPSGPLGGEPDFVGQTNGLWLYQHDVGKVILDQLLADGEGARVGTRNVFRSGGWV